MSQVSGGYGVGSDWRALLGSASGMGETKGFSDTTTSYVMPRLDQAGAPAVSNIADGLTGAVSSIFSSFTAGLSNAISASAAGIGNYLAGGNRQLVGYDQYNNPIYSIRDPQTGAVYTTSTPGYPGAPGAPSQYIERTPTSRDGTGIWGWLTNTLSLPSPRPQQSIGTVPIVENSAATTMIGGFSLAQIGVGVGIAAALFVGVKVLSK